MMGRKHREQANFFYEFRLDDMIPKGHLLRLINVFVTSVLGDLHEQLGPFYSDIGRPSIDPELFGIRSERKLCEEFRLRLAYRWFCRLDLNDAVRPVTSETFDFALDRKKLRQARRREGSYLLRSNIKSDDPGHLWRLYLQVVEVEQAFKELKNDLSIRPIYHQLETRIEAHIFIAFLAYCLLVTLKQRLKTLAQPPQLVKSG